MRWFLSISISLLFISVAVFSSLYLVPERAVHQYEEVINKVPYVRIDNPYDLIEGESKTALFIGNSHTYINSLPDIVARVSEKCLGKNVWFDTSLVGGKDLAWHIKHGEALNKIKSRKWDYVFLQPMGVEPLSDFSSFKESVSLLQDAIVKSGAKPILLETWARDPKNDSYDVYNKLNIPRSFHSMQDLLSEKFDSAKGNSLIAPAGDFWSQVLKSYPNFKLLADDGYHPAPLGTYISSLAVINTIFFGNSKKLKECSYTSDGVDLEEATKVKYVIF